MVTEKVEFDVGILKEHTRKSMNAYCKSLENKLLRLKSQLNEDVILQAKFI